MKTASTSLPILIVATVAAAAATAGPSPGPFPSWAAQTASAATASGRTAIPGRQGWLFFAPELRHLGAGAPRADADPVPAIVDFKNQLERQGVELLLVPVPAKAAIYPEHLPPGAPAPGGSLDRDQQAFHAALARSGVKVLDLSPVFVASKKGAPLYCQTDTHWSGEGCVVAARSIAADVKARSWYTGLTRQRFESERRSIELTGDLARASKLDRRETLPMRFVGSRDSDTLRPVAPDRASPILLIGDSHNLVFHAGADMFAAGAGLPDQLALELGVAVDVLAVRGSGATPARVNLARRARADASYLKAKKLVIWCFSVRELTESTGWQKVPLLGTNGGK